MGCSAKNVINPLVTDCSIMRSNANNQLTTAALVFSSAITDESLSPGAYWNYWKITGSFLATAFPSNVGSITGNWIA